jgi:beta-lactamase class A
VALSVRNLIELMMLISDNSATDICLRPVGGAEAVNGRLKALGIDGIRVDRPTLLLILDAVGVRARRRRSPEWTPGTFAKLLDAVPAAERQAARLRFDADPRDTATPEGDGAAARADSEEGLPGAGQWSCCSTSCAAAAPEGPG